MINPILLILFLLVIIVCLVAYIWYLTFTISEIKEQKDANQNLFKISHKCNQDLIKELSELKERLRRLEPVEESFKTYNQK